MAFVFSDIVEIVGPHMRKNRPAHVSVKIVKQGDAHLRFFSVYKMDRKLERLFIGKVRTKSRGLTNVDVFERTKAERDIKCWEGFPRHADTQVKRRRLNNTEVAQALLLEDKVANVTVATHGKTHSLNILITKPCEKHVMVELNNANLQFFK